MPALQLWPTNHDAPDLVAALLAADLPADDLGEPNRLFFRVQQGSDVIGFAGYEPYGQDVLLRSVVILPAWRGLGLGKQLTKALLDRAGAEGATTAYLLTTTATEFFRAAGFEKVARPDAPDDILATREARDLCPSTAALMARPIARYS